MSFVKDDEKIMTPKDQLIIPRNKQSWINKSKIIKNNLKDCGIFSDKLFIDQKPQFKTLPNESKNSALCNPKPMTILETECTIKSPQIDNKKHVPVISIDIKTFKHKSTGDFTDLKASNQMFIKLEAVRPDNTINSNFNSWINMHQAQTQKNQYESPNKIKENIIKTVRHSHGSKLRTESKQKNSINQCNKSCVEPRIYSSESKKDISQKSNLSPMIENGISPISHKKKQNYFNFEIKSPKSSGDYSNIIPKLDFSPLKVVRKSISSKNILDMSGTSLRVPQKMNTNRKSIQVNSNVQCPQKNPDSFNPTNIRTKSCLSPISFEKPYKNSISPHEKNIKQSQKTVKKISHSEPKSSRDIKTNLLNSTLNHRYLTRNYLSFERAKDKYSSEECSNDGIHPIDSFIHNVSQQETHIEVASETLPKPRNVFSVFEPGLGSVRITNSILFGNPYYILRNHIKKNSDNDSKTRIFPFSSKTEKQSIDTEPRYKVQDLIENSKLFATEQTFESLDKKEDYGKILGSSKSAESSEMWNNFETPGTSRSPPIIQRIPSIPFTINKNKKLYDDIKSIDNMIQNEIDSIDYEISKEPSLTHIPDNKISANLSHTIKKRNIRSSSLFDPDETLRPLSNDADVTINKSKKFFLAEFDKLEAKLKKINEKIEKNIKKFMETK